MNVIFDLTLTHSTYARMYEESCAKSVVDIEANASSVMIGDSDDLGISTNRIRRLNCISELRLSTQSSKAIQYGFEKKCEMR